MARVGPDETKSARTVLNVATAVIVVVGVVVGVVIATRHSNLSLPPTSQQDLVFSPDGSTAYVAGAGQVGVERLSGTGVVTSDDISVPGKVTHLVITPNGHTLLVATDTGGTSGVLSTVDLTTAPPTVSHVFSGRLIESLAMAPDGNFALVAAGGAVARLSLDDPGQGLTGTVAVDTSIDGLAVAPGGDNAFALGRSGDSGAGTERLTTLQLTTSPIGVKGSVGVQGRGVLLAPDGFTAYVGGDIINVLTDPPALLPAAKAPAGIGSLAGYTAQSITPNGRFVYLSGGQVTGAGGDNQVVEDTATSPPITTSLSLTDCTNALINPQGTDVYCGAELHFPVLPSLESVSPDHGGAAGGYNITLTGTSFNAATVVDLGSSPAAIGAINRTGTTMTVTVPSGTVGSVPVSVTTPGGTSPVNSGANFTYTPSPAVSGIKPDNGVFQGGTQVLIGGSGFTQSAVVDFGPGNPGKVLNVSPDGKYMAVQAPAGRGTVHVIVTTDQGPSFGSVGSKFHFTRIPPQVMAIRPGKGSGAGGYGILIGGKFLNGTTQVHFGVTPARVEQVASDGDFIGVIVPPGVGTVDVTVTTPSGTSANVPADQFTYSGTGGG